MNDKGFVSLVSLFYFSVVIAFVLNGLFIIKKYHISKSYLKELNKESLIESIAIKTVYDSWEEFSFDDFCDIIEETEVCYEFVDNQATITIDHPRCSKVYTVIFNRDGEFIEEIVIKFDK